MKDKTKNRLFEVMAILNPEIVDSYYIKIINESYSNNKNIYENETEEDQEEDQEEEPSPKEIEKLKKLDADSNNPNINDGNSEKPITNKNENVNFKVTVLSKKKKSALKAIESLKKLAKRIGSTEPNINYSDEYQKIFTTNTEPPMRYALEVFDIEINTVPMFNMGDQYKLVAVVDNIGGGSIEIDPNENVPSEILKTNGQCDLCNQERFRGKNFIIKDVSKNEFLCVGSSCVKKYIGINPNKYIASLSYLKDMREALALMGEIEDDDFGNIGSGRRGLSPTNIIIDTDKAITLAKNLYDEFGYVKKEFDDYRNRTNDGDANSDRAEKLIMSNIDDFNNNYEVDSDFIENIRNYFNNFKQDPNKEFNSGFQEYIEKIKNLINGNANTRIKDIGMITSAINMYSNNIKRDAEMKTLKNSEWIGNVGEKLKFPYLKLIDARTGEGNYGTWYLWKFVDDKGNIVNKFGNLSENFIIEKAPEDSENLFGFNKGDVFAFISDIKKHDEYNGVKNTTIGRLSKLK